MIWLIFGVEGDAFEGFHVRLSGALARSAVRVVR
jgi:hypothetical protein